METPDLFHRLLMRNSKYIYFPHLKHWTPGGGDACMRQWTGLLLIQTPRQY